MSNIPENAVHPLSRAEWRAWLEQNHTRTNGIWLISYKQATSQPRMSYDESVEQALCFGWIDSKSNKLDDQRSMLWFAPRKARTGWSLPNKQRIERMIAAGHMTPAGYAKIQAAQQDGSWSLLDDVEALIIPADLEQALAEYPLARSNFNAFPRSAKRGILEWIVIAKTAPTRAKRIAETACLAQENVRANQWHSKDTE